MGRTRVLIMFLYGHMTQVWSCTGKQKGSQKQRWVLAFARGITVASMSTSGCASCGLGPEYCIGRGGRHWLLSLWGIPNTPRTYLPTLKEKRNLKDWALWSKAAGSLRKRFNKLAQRKTLSNALLWGVRSPMRKNERRQLCRNSCKINFNHCWIKSKTSYMHPILAQMDAYTSILKLEVVGKKKNKK